MPSLFMPTHATETLEYTLGNATLAAENSVSAVSTATQAAGNLTAVATTLNSGTKALSFGYGIALTGASVIDACAASNTASRILFGIGGVCGAAGTFSSGFSVLNNTIGMPAFGLAAGAAGSAFYWLGRKVNSIARVTDLPGV